MAFSKLPMKDFCLTTPEEIDKEEAARAIIKNVGIVLDKPRLPQFATLASRKQTFGNYLTKLRDIDLLVEAGFYLDIRSEILVCYHCERSSKLFFNQDPWIVHVRIFPYCAHVRQCKGDKFIIDILENVSDNKSNVTDFNLEDIIEINKTAFEAVKENYKDETVVKKAVEFLFKRQSKKTFTGTELALVIEEYTYKEMLDLLEKDIKIKPESNDAITGDVECEKMIKENENLKSAISCKICLVSRACIIILSCGHLSCCSQCVPALNKCPICRKPIQGTVRALFATDNK